MAVVEIFSECPVSLRKLPFITKCVFVRAVTHACVIDFPNLFENDEF